MPAITAAAFLDNFGGSLASSWDPTRVTQLSMTETPHDLAGSRWSLLMGDSRFLWAEWWIPTFGDPARLHDADYPELYEQIRNAAVERFPGEPPADVNAAASQIALLLQDLIRRRAQERRPLTDLDRRQLVVDAGSPPRCWICGWRFPQLEVDRFLRLTEATNEETPLPLFVDLVMPRGRNSSNLRVNADHVVPVASGGRHEGNLRLACGWCNRSQSASVSIYEAMTMSTYDHSLLGTVSLPHPLWVVRTLAITGRCESPIGCTRTTRTHELTVAPRWQGGSMTPSNILVTCREHDPWSSVRWVPRSSL
jgi:hypothetical protein